MSIRFATSVVVLSVTLVTLVLTARGQEPVVYELNDGSLAALPVAHENTAAMGGACDSACEAKACDTMCDCCCSGGWLSDVLPCNKCCDLPQHLFPQRCGGWNIYGWINGGYTYNAHRNPSHFNGTVGFNDRDDGQVNQVYMVLEKAIDPDCCLWQIGGRADMLWGTDGRYVQATGLELNSTGDFDLNSGRRFYHLAFPQFYGELGRGDFSVIAGHFYSILGYESVMAPANFFYSRSYTKLYGEPFTLTGVLARGKTASNVEFAAGMHNGWDNFNREAARFTLIGGGVGPDLANQWGAIGSLGWTSFDERFSLVCGYIWGRELDARLINRHLFTNVGTVNLTDRLQWVVQGDIGYQNNSAINDPIEWWSVVNYLYYTINDCWKAGLRVELFRDDDASRVAPIDRFDNPASFQAYSGDFHAITAGLNWTPRPNIIVRPELRWDWFDNANVQNSTPFGETGTPPFGNFSDKQYQFLAGIDAIILW